MKHYIKAFISTLLIASVLLQINYTCFAVTKGKKLFTDNSGITLISFNNNKVFERQLVPDNKSFTYGLPGKVIDSCAVSGKVYILCLNTSKQNSAYLFKAKSGKINNPKTLNKIKLNNSCRISVDSKENYLITNSSNKIQVYNQSGAYIKTFDKKVDNILQMSGYIIAVSGNKLYKVTDSGFTLLNESVGSSSIYKISGDYIGDYYGNIFHIKNGIKKVIKTDVQGLYQAAETEKYIIVFADKKFQVYDKSNYSYINTIKYDQSLYGISSYKNKVAVIKKDDSYSTELLAQSYFKSDESSNNNKNTSDKSTPAGISLKSFKHTDKYIYVDSGLTIADFKNKISYNGYDINFGSRKSGKIRTNTDLTFTKGSYSKSYKFVVKGDVTGEGNVNSRDEAAVFDHLLKIKELKGANKEAGDLNFDSKLKNADLLLLSKMIN